MKPDRRNLAARAMMHVIYTLQALQPAWHGDKQSARRIQDARKHLALADKDLARPEMLALMADNEPPLFIEPPASPARAE